MDRETIQTGQQTGKGIFAILKRCERLMISALMLMMTLVLGLATIDLGWLIIADIISNNILLSVNQLLDIFGLFMLVLIGIELLETIIKTYLTQEHPHVEVVLAVAIIAISRKVIILDPKEQDSLGLLGIAAIIIALSIGYYLMKRSHRESHPTNHSAD